MDPAATPKLCSKCGESKDYSSFRMGRTKCKECAKLDRVAYTSNNKVRLRKIRADRYILNRETNIATAKQWAKDNKERAAFNAARKRARKLKATPNWLTDLDFQKMQMLYNISALVQKQTGVKMHVDHIIPLQGKNVSGFHMPENLTILKATDNISKSNSFEPIWGII